MSGTLTYTTGNDTAWAIENGKASKWSTGSGTGANPTVNHDPRSDGGTGARLHKWNSPNFSGGSYQPYQEAWYDGNSYHYLKVQSNSSQTEQLNKFTQLNQKFQNSEKNLEKQIKEKYPYV